MSHASIEGKLNDSMTLSEKKYISFEKDENHDISSLLLLLLEKDIPNILLSSSQEILNTASPTYYKHNLPIIIPFSQPSNYDALFNSPKIIIANDMSSRSDLVNNLHGILKTQSYTDYFIYNIEDSISRFLSTQTSAIKVPFSQNSRHSKGVCIFENSILFNDKPIVKMPNSSDINPHCIATTLAAITTAKLLGVTNITISEILESLKNF